MKHYYTITEWSEDGVIITRQDIMLVAEDIEEAALAEFAEMIKNRLEHDED